MNEIKNVESSTSVYTEITQKDYNKADTIIRVDDNEIANIFQNGKYVSTITKDTLLKKVKGVKKKLFAKEITGISIRYLWKFWYGESVERRVKVKNGKPGTIGALATYKVDIDFSITGINAKDFQAFLDRSKLQKDANGSYLYKNTVIQLLLQHLDELMEQYITEVGIFHSYSNGNRTVEWNFLQLSEKEKAFVAAIEDDIKKFFARFGLLCKISLKQELRK